MTIGTDPKWDINHLRAHLRFAAELEFWTIPFYISAFWSVTKDIKQMSDPGKLILSVAVQEMFHFQCACNIANAFQAFDYVEGGYKFPLPSYSGSTIPHLDFKLDKPNPTTDPVPYPPPDGSKYDFRQYSEKLGPVDKSRINTMCLIEYPNWNPLNDNEKQETVTDYASIGHFYEALKIGIESNKDSIKVNYKQQDLSITKREFHDPDFPQIDTVVSGKNRNGKNVDPLAQVQGLLCAITIQGEGSSLKTDTIPEKYQNKGIYQYEPSKSHFEKFLELYKKNPTDVRKLKANTDIYDQITNLQNGKRGQDGALQSFLGRLTEIFVQGNPNNVDMDPPMTTLSQTISNCYE